MPSPFPGMNPYLERSAVWTDFHNAYLNYFRETLAPRVAPRYYVAIEERVYLHEDDESDRKLLGRPDADIAFEKKPVPQVARKGSTAVAAPVKSRIPKLRKRKVAYLEVVDSEDRTVVTVVEMLSPSNKYAGDDRENYLAKRREMLGTAVNFVELDFLRGGPRMPLKDLPSCDYYAMVSRPPARPDVDVWPVRLRDPLPSILLPLGPDEDEASIDLQAVLHRTYEAAGYQWRGIYEGEPEPKLAPSDAEWAKQILEAAKA